MMAALRDFVRDRMMTELTKLVDYSCFWPASAQCCEFRLVRQPPPEDVLASRYLQEEHVLRDGTRHGGAKEDLLEERAGLRRFGLLSTEASAEGTRQPSGFLVPLQGYQLKSLRWMLGGEGLR